MNKGFTLIELIVTIAIIAVLSSIILFSITQYINMSKDANITGNLSVLIPAGETYYNTNGETYAEFCQNQVVTNAFSQVPYLTNSNCCGSGAYTPSCGTPCCQDFSASWVACAAEFVNPDKAYCVDSRGVRKEIDNSLCDYPMASSQCP